MVLKCRKCHEVRPLRDQAAADPSGQGGVVYFPASVPRFPLSV
jgi:hypothetical protein